MGTRASTVVGGLGVATLLGAFVYGTQSREACGAPIGFAFDPPGCDPVRAAGIRTVVFIALIGVALLVAAYVMARRTSHPVPVQARQGGQSSLRPVVAFFVGCLGVITGFVLFLAALTSSSGVTGPQAHAAGEAAGHLAFLVGTPLGIAVGILLARRSAAKQQPIVEAWPAPVVPAPGWYADTAGVTRWWDGGSWTDHTAP